VDATVIVLIVVVVLLVAVGIAMMSRRRRSQQLQEHFGPEYERRVAETGDPKAAEAELAGRQKRRQEFDIRSLRPEERERFQGSWYRIQRDFVDDPERSLHDADDLVVEVMRLRGYPVEGDFDRRADDLSVDHPQVVQHYREARSVRDAAPGDGVDTERQRHALTSYRSLVEALLGAPARNRDGATDRAEDSATTTRRTEEQTR
jgi:hypothetical protein